MGKRELYIAIGFLGAGVIAYWLTDRPGERSFTRRSLPALVDEWRQNEAQSAARETVQSVGRRTLDRQVSEIRVAGFTRVHIVAETRPDVEWTLEAEASGPTPEMARASAATSVVNQDDLGSALLLSPEVPENVRATTEVTVRLPAALAVRLEGARRATVEGAGRVRLEGLVGDVMLRSVGAVTGSHRNGTLAVDEAGSVNLHLNGSRATFTQVAGEVTLIGRNGDCRLIAPGGLTVLDFTNVALAVADSAGSLRANLVGGRIDLARARHDVHIDARNSTVELSLDRAVHTTVVGANTPVAIRLAADLAIELDASITDGAIDATGVGLAPEQTDHGERVRQTFGTDARVTVRATRGSIVIARRK